jgi:poly-gamma-glutamate capsule biosynthesis protein CapA/YwtB (metallophosphatase superfamily)
MIEQRHAGAQSQDALTVLLTGDMVLDEPDAGHWLSGIAPALQSADLTVAHLEVPHTRRGAELAGDVPAPGADPDNLDALARAGVGMVSLAGNHIADCGAEGIADTVARLAQLGIAHAGAGADLGAASRLARVERKGHRVSLLSYNCVGPEAAWAGPQRAGCNYLRMESQNGQPVAPSAPLVAPSAEALQRLREDVRAARAESDLLIVALHKGIVHTPATLAPYERPLAEAALDAGADVVVGHHAHILRGVELRAGRPLFHGLGNGCVVTRALSPSQDHPARAAWAKKRREMFGFEPDPRYELAPFHPEAVHAVIGVVRREVDGTLRMGVMPVHVEPPGRPVCVSDARAVEVIAYLDRIGAMAGLPPRQWQRDGQWLWWCS